MLEKLKAQWATLPDFVKYALIIIAVIVVANALGLAGGDIADS